MTPGPTIIRKCSTCAKLIEQPTIASGSTDCGDRVWSDGKVDTPLLPDQPWMVKCGHCESILWIDEQEQVGEVGESRNDVDTGAEIFADASPYVIPSIQDYIAFLLPGVSNMQKELYIRQRVWWAGNDVRRQSDNAAPITEVERANLAAIIQLLDVANENDRIMMAEIMRELGRFAEAADLLKPAVDKKHQQGVAIIKGLITQKNARVAEMKFKIKWEREGALTVIGLENYAMPPVRRSIHEHLRKHPWMGFSIIK